MEVISAISRTWICIQSPTVVQNATNYGKQRKPWINMKKPVMQPYDTCSLVVHIKYHKPFLTYLKGFHIPENLKYFRYRATFDFECYFKNENQHPRNTEKLTWEAEHVPLSVSVSSIVPGYDQPKCFVSSGSAKEMIKQFIGYLVVISQESYTLLLDRFSDVFDQIKQRMVNNEACCAFLTTKERWKLVLIIYPCLDWTLNEIYTIILLSLVCVIFVHIILLYFRTVKRARMKPMRYIIFRRYLKYLSLSSYLF